MAGGDGGLQYPCMPACCQYVVLETQGRLSCLHMWEILCLVLVWHVPSPGPNKISDLEGASSTLLFVCALFKEL